jgi:DNA-directed RNA polymerase subunit omega
MALGTSPHPTGVAKPTIDELVSHTDGNKYALAMFAAKRARQINSYFNQLNEGVLQNVGPLVEYGNNEKPLSIAFREINEGLLEEKLASDEQDSDDEKINSARKAAAAKQKEEAEKNAQANQSDKSNESDQSDSSDDSVDSSEK